ncbi:MAG TPA: M24 family metallopeptidase [Thermoleophilaceae bacterium]|nr:M24 family metallopeptidase [Thermoleophilaceae bacterium]
MTNATEAIPYPRFSEAEMARRRDALASELEAAGAAHALLYGANRAGPAVAWLTRWPVTREALCLFTPGERDLLLVNFYNHVPNAQRIATEAEVRWAGPKPMATALSEFERRGARGERVAVIGPLGYRPYAALAEVATPLPFDDSYTRLRLRKSAEELEWLRLGCAFTDDAVRAVHEQAGPGTDERELGNLAERAYVGRGGTTHIHYFGATAMSEPSQSVPAQWPAARLLERGDVLTCEVSASYWDYTGQLLRTFSVADEPPPLYRELHEVADATFDALLARVRPGATAAELVEASAPIGDAGFTTRDDLVHGFVGGYLPPVLGDKTRSLDEIPDFTLEEGMTIVIQPNVVTPDESAGVQTGELIAVTPDGAERLHDYERGLLRIG